MGDLGGYDGNDAAVGVLVDGVTSNIETADIQTQEARHYNADQGTIGAATIQAAERPRDGGVAGPVVVAGRAMDSGANSVVFGVAEAAAVGSDAAGADGTDVGGVAGLVVVAGRGTRGSGVRGRGSLGGRGDHSLGLQFATGDIIGEILQLLEEERTASDAATTPSRTTPILPQDVYVNKLVAFCPDKEKWMRAKAYRPPGTAYIIGRVYRQGKKGKYASLFEIRWLDSQFQKAVEHVSVGVLQRGIKNYSVLIRMKNPDWRILVQPDPTDDIDFEENDSDCEEEEVFKAFDPTGSLPTSLEEVEAIRNMRFVPSGDVEAPSYLFFAYIPQYFWRQVLHETNKYAVLNDVRMGAPFTLDELMIFLGILFYMAVTDKGEYANYRGRQAEDLLFCGVSTSLDGVMTLHRFKLLRRCFSFNAAPTTLEQDAVARIRPLLNLLKVTGGKFYMVCCSTTWVALNFKLHCQRSDVMHRLGGVINQSEAQSLSDQLAKLEKAKIRQHVLEVTRPLYGTNRIVNMDDYYTSIQLLQGLHLKGLYGRGTVRSKSKHYPIHSILPEADCVRGDYRQSVSHNHSMLAVS
ncbi:unnamed protein product [Phytophthora fragariaefolia]|uniref:Unnamed protein product n=1 Tax=Phytophthora fragariaefolia TaxID=1490495 RepID=A0A9W6Y5C7_9STRA|nr:unnamed protein product [Phytophthora fragariaefolia]